MHSEEKLIKELDKWEDVKATDRSHNRKTTTGWSKNMLSSLIVIPKKLKPGQEAKGTEVRPNIDMRLPKKAILKTQCHIPTVTEVRDKLQKAKAAVNLALHPESRGITAHHTPKGPRRPTRLNYGTNISSWNISEGNCRGIIRNWWLF